MSVIVFLDPSPQFLLGHQLRVARRYHPARRKTRSGKIPLEAIHSILTV
jgi:hypothetical protein